MGRKQTQSKVEGAFALWIEGKPEVANAQLKPCKPSSVKGGLVLDRKVLDTQSNLLVPMSIERHPIQMPIEGTC